MEAKIYGNLTRPAVIVAGTWDPLFLDYFILIEHINQYCIDSGYEALIVVLDPPPVHLLHNKVLPIFDCYETRIKYLKSKCHGVVCKFSMNESDLDDGVEDFLQLFFNLQCNIAELWLYEGQTMGRGGKSSIQSIINSCLKVNVKVKTIPGHLNFKTLAHSTKLLLRDGQIEQAIKIAGHFPLWEKSNEANVDIPIGWQNGIYEYFPTTLSSDFEVQFLHQPDELEVYTNKLGNAVFDWPDMDKDIIAITRLIKRAG